LVDFRVLAVARAVAFPGSEAWAAATLPVASEVCLAAVLGEVPVLQLVSVGSSPVVVAVRLPEASLAAFQHSAVAVLLAAVLQASPASLA
jgi:hypothetical protein